MRAMPVASPHSIARLNASRDTAIVSNAPCSNGGRNWIMSVSENNAKPPFRQANGLVVVAGQPPLRENLLQFTVILHPLHRGRKRGHPLDVTLAERIAAVARGVFERPGLIVLDNLDLPLGMLLHLRSDHRLVIQGCIRAPDCEFRNDLCPVLVALKVHAL